MKISIIGTAGRKSDGQKMTSELYMKMIKKTCEIIKSQTELSSPNSRVESKEITLVSGGAAWSDHIAVNLYLSGKFGKLILYLPCKLKDNSKVWNTMKYYHELFSKKMYSNCKESNSFHTLSEISLALEKGAILGSDSGGFHSRNTLVAQSDYIIAFTWGNGDIPKDGGTLDTWNKSNGKKIHVSLNSLK